jgi:hypothetical protein
VPSNSMCILTEVEEKQISKMAFFTTRESGPMPKDSSNHSVISPTGLYECSYPQISEVKTALARLKA